MRTGFALVRVFCSNSLTMTKWEYMVVSLSDNSASNEQMALNNLGMQGWELTALCPPLGGQDRHLSGCLIFKRPLG